MRETSAEKIKDNIFCYIKLKGVSLHSVTTAAGLAHGYLHMLKQTNGYPDLEKLLKLCLALDVPVEDMLYKDYRTALEQKELHDIDVELARLQKRKRDLNENLIRRAKECQG